MTQTSTPPASATRVGIWLRFWAWLPTSVDGRVRVAAWLSFLAEVLIIGTGGAVRLTGSGLGCTEWPLCTPDSLVPVLEVQGIHGLIEFGYRTLTGLVGILALIVLTFTLSVIGARREFVRTLRYAGIAIVLAAIAYALARFTIGGDYSFSIALFVVLVCCVFAAVSTIRTVTRRRDLVILAWIVFIGIVAQAFVGGITVLTGLNPLIVGFHYVSSLILVCVTTVYLVRMDTTPGPRELAVPKWFMIVSHTSGLALAVTVVFGILTTGAGPHSGDANVIRTGFDASLLAHIHAWPGYALAALIAVLTAFAVVYKLPPRNWLFVLIAAIVIQEAVGIWQSRAGLPALLVGIHMVLAALTSAAYTVTVLTLKRPAADVPR